ncbi:MAG: CHAD domain-containing protein [Candidatus Sulfotelmatobacter sp.]
MSLDREKFHKPVKILRKLLKKFPRRPLPEHVHRLRTHTRRLDAMLQGLMLTSRRNERRLVEAIARLRKRAGKVRDMDVLAGFVCTLRVSGENDCRIQLLEHLGAQRFRRARKLYNLVRVDGHEMQRRLKRCLTDMDRALENRNVSMNALALSHRLSAELASPPRLDAGNLHDYRKKVKELYYLLQFLNHSNAHFAETLGRVKDAIGKWHDWEELAAIADRLFDHYPACNLVEEIQSIRQAKFEHALAIANEMRTKYVGATFSPRGNRRGRQRRPAIELVKPGLVAPSAIAA